MNNNKKEHIFAVNIPVYHSDPVVVRYEVGGDATLDSMIEAFESFLKSLGYVFPAGMHLGYEEDDDLGVIPDSTWEDLENTDIDYNLNNPLPASNDDVMKNKEDKNNLL